MLGFLGLLDPIINLLKSTGIIKDSTQEAALKEQLAQAAAVAEQAQAAEFKAFLDATTPSPQYVAPWANTLITVTRPAITWLVTGSIILSFFIPGMAAKVQGTVAAFNSGGPAGLMLLSIPMWWFAGRTAEKIWTSKNGNGGSK